MSAFSVIRKGVLAGMMVAGAAVPAIAQTNVTVVTVTPAPVAGESAQAKADAARTRARLLAQQGGWNYKCGAVDRANAEAARYQKEADAAALAAAPVAPVSPELAAAQENLDQLRQSGGWAYKTGAVTRAEAEVARLSAVPGQEVIGLYEAVSPSNWNKPVEKSEHVYR